MIWNCKAAVRRDGRVLLASALAGPAALLLGCSPAAGHGGENADLYGPAEGGAAGGTFIATGATANTYGAGGSQSLVPLVPQQENPTSPDGSCAATTHAAENVVVTKQVPVQKEVVTRGPVALYFMQDRSGSMLEPYYPPPSKWDLTLSAVKAFTGDPASAGINVALQFFPDDSGQCNGSRYDVPNVAMGPLPQNAAAINGSFAAHGATGGNTPIEGGLNGAVRYCAAYQQSHSTEKCAAVLITDGAPNGCNEDFAALAAIAANAKANGVFTFTVGMAGADFGLLDSIAKAGGTDCTPGAAGTEACNVSGGGSSFVDALDKIRDSVTTVETHIETVTETQSTKIDCEFEMPAAPGGQKFDREKVNVQFSSSGMAAQKILQVPAEADCGTAGGGWHYDDPGNPTKVILCAQTCSTVQATAAARVDVLLGCATEKAIAR